MTLDPGSMPPLLRDFAVAVRCSSRDQARLCLPMPVFEVRAASPPAAHLPGDDGYPVANDNLVR